MIEIVGTLIFYLYLAVINPRHCAHTRVAVVSLCVCLFIPVTMLAATLFFY